MSRPTEFSQSPDLVLYGGQVLTLDAGGSRPSALAARDGVVRLCGSDREMLALVGPQTQTLDLHGRTVVPGFVETHSHPYFYGLTLDAAVDAGSPPNDSIADLVDRVAHATRHAPEAEWVVGYRYDDTLLREARHPTRSDLDAVSPHHPVLLVHVSGHFAVTNSVGLRRAGVSRTTPDPPGGVIGRDESGEPTGLLAENAAFWLYALMPKRSSREMGEVLGLAGDAYLAAGVTTVHDTGVGLLNGLADLDAYTAAFSTGRLRTRVRGYLWDHLLDDVGGGVPGPGVLAPEGVDRDRFEMAGIKIIADGSIQGMTGCLSEPYTCAPSERGIMLLSPQELTDRVAALDSAGWQVAVHGNGDAAIQAVIDAYRGLGGSAGTGHRHRIEHCQTVREDQLDQMAQYGVLASFFVKHVYYWGDRHHDRFLGPERARRINPLASARRHGIRFGLHADSPVTPVPPLEGIWCAVARRTRKGNALGPEHAIDAETALRAYTSEAAHLGFDEEHRGTLEPGKVADFAVLSADPTAVSADGLRDVEVEATAVGGEIVWARDGARVFGGAGHPQKGSAS